MTTALLFLLFLSLFATSEGLSNSQRQAVANATTILRQKGFSREASVLTTLAMYRSTDNWWNQYVGHLNAYAATNFPFQVVTLYPTFFTVAVDDAERAAILLHESYHLLGSGEDVALQGVWLRKQQLGWTADGYSHTRVWRNTKEWTEDSVPGLFNCGLDGQSDCAP